MNIAVILAGGVGSRMHMGTVPKQYLEVGGRPIVTYCMRTLEHSRKIDRIVIVAEAEWRPLINAWMEKDHITKFAVYAEPGRTRQHSVYSALRMIAQMRMQDTDVVLIQDAARPLTSERIICDCLEAAARSGGAMPVITVKDTIYQSADGKMIGSLLNRDQLYAGQAPEAFRFCDYYHIHETMTDEEIAHIRGSSEIAYRGGMSVELVKGEEVNFKITTPEDLDKFRMILSAKEQFGAAGENAAGV